MKNWVRPQAEVEEFAANEYIAACENGKTLWFVCDAGRSGRDYDVYQENGKAAGLQKYGVNRDTLLTNGFFSSYSPCNIKHEVTPDVKLYDGYLDNGTKVLIWKGEKNNNIHCTTKLDVQEFEVAKS